MYRRSSKKRVMDFSFAALAASGTNRWRPCRDALSSYLDELGKLLSERAGRAKRPWTTIPVPNLGSRGNSASHAGAGYGWPPASGAGHFRHAAPVDIIPLCHTRPVNNPRSLPPPWGSLYS